MDNNKNIEVIQLSQINIPLPYQDIRVADDKMVTYGYDNLYPNFLLKLYDESPIHSSIINSKAVYIVGDGIKYEDGVDIKINVNAQDSFDEFIGKCIIDFLIYNYFAVEVIFNAFNQPIEYHWIPAHLIRTNKLKTKFWYSEDWVGRKKPIVYDRFNPNNNTTPVSKIFFFDGYFPSVNSVYPNPEYNGAIKSVTTDIAIRDFNLNNIKNHFSVSTLITFFNGSNLADEVKRQVVRDLKESYTGENGKKFIVDFQSQNGKSADVRNISPGDWDKAYTIIAKSVQDDLFIAHSVTSPSLLGVKTEGQLGGTQELEIAYEIFKNTYVRIKRNALISAFNTLFTNSTIINGTLVFTDRPLFNTQITDKLKEKIYTINELRKDAGLPDLPNGDRLLADMTPVPVAASVAQPQPMSQPKYTNDIKQNNDVKPTKEGKILTEEDFELVKHLGTNKEEFEVAHEFHAFSAKSDVANYVIKNDIQNLPINTLIDELAKNGINVGKNELKGILGDLADSGILSVNISEKDNVTVKPSPKTNIPNTGEVVTMYDYVKRPEVAGSTLISTSRNFCKSVINANKYYSREDIQSMSTIFGYDVFKHAGGWFYNPETDEATNYCRHEWNRVTLRRKK